MTCIQRECTHVEKTKTHHKNDLLVNHWKSCTTKIRTVTHRCSILQFALLGIAYTEQSVDIRTCIQVFIYRRFIHKLNVTKIKQSSNVLPTNMYDEFINTPRMTSNVFQLHRHKSQILISFLFTGSFDDNGLQWWNITYIYPVLIFWIDNCYLCTYILYQCTWKQFSIKIFFFLKKIMILKLTSRFLCTLKLEKNKKSHLSPANDVIDITDDHYDPFIHQQVEDYTAMNMQKYSNMPKKK